MAGRVLIDDLGVSLMHRSVLEFQLKAAQSCGNEIVWLSTLELEPPSFCGLKTSSEKKLWTRWWVLAERKYDGPILYLEGNSLITGDVTALLKNCPVGRILNLTGDEYSNLLGLDCFVMNPGEGWGEIKKEFRRWAGEYDTLVNPGLLKSDLFMVMDKSLITHELPVAVLRRIQDRPWYNARARMAEFWTEQAIKVIESGRFPFSMVLDEIETGKLRPSLRYQIENRTVRLCELPSALIELDLAFIPAEMAVPESRRIALCSHHEKVRSYISLVRRKFEKNPRGAIIWLLKNITKQAIKRTRKSVSWFRSTKMGMESVQIAKPIVNGSRNLINKYYRTNGYD